MLYAYAINASNGLTSPPSKEQAEVDKDYEIVTRNHASKT